jgi:hypothetical protein
MYSREYNTVMEREKKKLLDDDYYKEKREADEE